MYSTTSPEQREIAQEQIDSLFTVLEDWFQAIEDGTVHHRLPDPTFELRPGRPPITEALVDEFIKELDREIDTDAFGSQGRKYEADASSEFHRLDYPQRVALVQQLIGIMLSEKEMGQKAETLQTERLAATPLDSG